MLDYEIVKRRHLPVDDFEQQILESVSNSNVTIIQADTGAGKSTRVPQMLMSAGYDVVMTEPTRISARTLVSRIADEMQVEVGNEVGYCTAFEKQFSKATKILITTDGFQLVRTLTNTKIDNKQKVLIIDEVHLWNLNIETLVAWCKMKYKSNWDVKLVLMSATMESHELKNYFGTNASVIDIPGRLYPVQEIEMSGSVSDIAKGLANQGHNVLVFVPGKRDIKEIMENLVGISAVVLPLHGELDIVAQSKCFVHYTLPKVIVATNVAQTSITIDDIDAVVDSGLERISDVVDGIEGTYIRDISKADCMQRKGRAGRTKPGIYVLCSETPFSNRKDYDTPEINRAILDQTVLRLAVLGIDASKLEFFHEPNEQDLIAAKNSLWELGALNTVVECDNIADTVTDIGKKMVKMPISCKYARMLVEADERGAVLEVIVITAILTIGSLLNRQDGSYDDHTRENQSDLLAELDIWNKFCNNYQIDFVREGLSAKNWFKVKEFIAKLTKSLEGLVTFSSTGNRQEIIKSCLVGFVGDMCKNYHEMSRASYCGASDWFSLDNHSCLCGHPDFIVGNQHSLEFKNKYGNINSINLVSMATTVKLQDILSLAPDLFTKETGLDPTYGVYSDDDCNSVIGCRSTTKLYYKGMLVWENLVADPNHPLAAELKADYEAEQAKQAEILAERKSYIDYDYQQTSSFMHTIPAKQRSVSSSIGELLIHYDWCDRPSIRLTTDELFSLTESCLKLDDGTVLPLECHMVDSTSVKTLQQRCMHVIKNDMIATAERMIPRISTSKLSIVVSWIPNLGRRSLNTHFEVKGHTVDCYCFLVESNNQYKLGVTTDAEVANKTTNASLLALFDREVRSNYSEKKFRTKVNGKLILTKAGGEAKEVFDGLVNDVREDITPDTFEEALGDVDYIFTEVMDEMKVPD